MSEETNRTLATAASGEKLCVESARHSANGTTLDRAESLPAWAQWAPGEALHRTLEGFRASIPPGVGLVLSIWPSLWPVALDAGTVHRVLVSPLERALGAIQEAARPRGGIITVMAHNASIRAVLHLRGAPPQPGDYVLLAVKDDGLGMTPEVEARLLEPSFATDGPGGGRAVGLASTMALLVCAGGGITYKTMVGNGTQFNLYLPVVGGRSGRRPAQGQ